jgi:hypothetical protein
MLLLLQKSKVSYFSFFSTNAALTINLGEFMLFPNKNANDIFFMISLPLSIIIGPTFLSGALAAQAEITPTAPSCPLVRGPARHAVLNVLWAAVNLLCVALAGAHLRKLKKDLGKLPYNKCFLSHKFVHHIVTHLVSLLSPIT